MTDTSRVAAPRRLAVFDLDGTLTRGDTYRGFVLQLLFAYPARWPRALLPPFLVGAYVLRLIDRGALKGGILHLLFAGMPRAVIAAFATRYAASVMRTQMFPAALRALDDHLAAGDRVVLLSASPDLYVPEIGRLLRTHETICTSIRWDGDALDGRLAGPNRRDAEKARVLKALRTAHPELPVIAYGNSTPDLEHMRLCEEAVFVNASRRLAARLSAEFPKMRLVSWR